MARHTRRKTQTRVIGYVFDADFDEPAVERVLEKAVVEGVVTQFDSGRGHRVWFNGAPGAALRAVRDKVKAIIKRGP